MEQNDFSTLIGLVSQYSPSGQESHAVEWLVRRMKSLGFSKAFIDNAGNAVGVMGTGGKQIVLLGHIDTVPGEIRVRQEDGVLFGRGTVDAKGPLSCFVDAVARLGEIDGWQLVVIGAVEEERNSDGARFVVDQYRPDYAVIGEPNHWNRVGLGYKGNTSVQLTIRRDKSHSASGENTACEEGVEAWLKIKAYADKFNAEKQKIFDRILPHLYQIHSEEGEFEEAVQLNINTRLPMDILPQDWIATLQMLLIENRGSRVDIQPIGYAVPAWRCEKNTPLIRAFLKSIRMQGGEPGFAYKTGTADLNIVAPIWKCPMVVYGPGDSSLDHTPDEQLELSEYSRAVNVLTNTFSALFLSG